MADNWVVEMWEKVLREEIEAWVGYKLTDEHWEEVKERLQEEPINEE